MERFPKVSRKMLKIKQHVNAKAMGLFASGYLNLYQQLREESYLRKAYECIEWLKQNESQGYSGACWGHPFDWRSLIFIPRGTPSGTVAAICGDAFWNFYEFTNDKKYLDVCKSICQFFLSDLNIDNVDNDRICFSYTPLDRFHVHNANLLVAEFLIRIGKHIGREELCEQGIRALNYTLDAQNEDGSFYYWALSDRAAYNIPEATAKNIDHYHTGFVLRSLYSIYKNTKEQRVFDVLSKGYQFYQERLFEDKTIPKLKPDLTYPVNIHSCAEAILCMATLSEVFPEAEKYARSAFMWTRENMQDKDGHFFYLKTARTTDKMPYIRWGQAWMLEALAALCSNLSEDGRA
jgi:rhamnogalacturonyl hydrolase YesR